jgi:hypothetical protein
VRFHWELIALPAIFHRRRCFFFGFLFSFPSSRALNPFPLPSASGVKTFLIKLPLSFILEARARLQTLIAARGRGICAVEIKILKVHYGTRAAEGGGKGRN